jgi:hypothetical protein
VNKTPLELLERDANFFESQLVENGHLGHVVEFVGSGGGVKVGRSGRKPLAVGNERGSPRSVGMLGMAPRWEYSAMYDLKEDGTR